MGQYNFIFIHNEKKKVPAISSLLSYLLKLTLLLDMHILENRSEERRVGKEC